MLSYKRDKNMRVTIEIPATSVCAVLSYVYQDESGVFKIATYTIETKKLMSGEVIRATPPEEEKDGKL